MIKHFVTCECGGGAHVVVAFGETTGVTECACGRVLLWSGPAEAAPLSFAIQDSASAGDSFGG